MRYLVLSTILILMNLVYSSWSTHVSKEYVKGLKDYKNEVERNLKLKSQIESKINYTNAKEHAQKAGFTSINWDKVLIVK